MSEIEKDEVVKTEEVSDDTITYDDFAKLHIRIGTITEVAVVEDADKLLCLQVDFGDYTRQIVSGIRAFVEDPQELVGTQSPFLTNLTTRKIRGLESQGMILAIGDADTFAFLRPSATVPAGTEVH